MKRKRPASKVTNVELQCGTWISTKNKNKENNIKKMFNMAPQRPRNPLLTMEFVSEPINITATRQSKLNKFFQKTPKEISNGQDDIIAHAPDQDFTEDSDLPTGLNLASTSNCVFEQEEQNHHGHPDIQCSPEYGNPKRKIHTSPRNRNHKKCSAEKVSKILDTSSQADITIYNELDPSIFGSPESDVSFQKTSPWPKRLKTCVSPKKKPLCLSPKYASPQKKMSSPVKKSSPPRNKTFSPSKRKLFGKLSLKKTASTSDASNDQSSEKQSKEWSASSHDTIKANTQENSLTFSQRLEAKKRKAQAEVDEFEMELQIEESKTRNRLKKNNNSEQFTLDTESLTFHRPHKKITFQNLNSDSPYTFHDRGNFNLDFDYGDEEEEFSQEDFSPLTFH